MDPYDLKLTILALTLSPEMPILGHRQGEPNRKQKRSWLKGLVAEMREGLPQPGPVCKSRRGRQWAEAPRGSKVHCKQAAGCMQSVSLSRIAVFLPLGCGLCASRVQHHGSQRAWAYLVRLGVAFQCGES